MRFLCFISFIFLGAECICNLRRHATYRNGHEKTGGQDSLHSCHETPFIVRPSPLKSIAWLFCSLVRAQIPFWNSKTMFAEIDRENENVQQVSGNSLAKRIESIKRKARRPSIVRSWWTSFIRSNIWFEFNSIINNFLFCEIASLWLDPSNKNLHSINPNRYR